MVISNKNIVIIGSSGYAKVILDIMQKEGKYNIVGLLDRNRKVGEETMGYKILGQEEDLPKLISEFQIIGGVIAIGDNYIRFKVSELIRSVSPNFKFVNAIHPNSSIGAEVQIGDGTVIMAGVIINPFSKIGDFCILNTNSSIDHDSIMEDFTSLAPGVTTGGKCTIGKFSVISIGATIIHNIEIGEHTIIGAGSLVVKSLSSNIVAYGLPAKEIRKREIGEKYL